MRHVLFAVLCCSAAGCIRAPRSPLEDASAPMGLMFLSTSDATQTANLLTARLAVQEPEFRGILRSRGVPRAVEVINPSSSSLHFTAFYTDKGERYDLVREDGELVVRGPDPVDPELQEQIDLKALALVEGEARDGEPAPPPVILAGKALRDALSARGEKLDIADDALFELEQLETPTGRPTIDIPPTMKLKPGGTREQAAIEEAPAPVAYSSWDNPLESAPRVSQGIAPETKKTPDLEAALDELTNPVKPLKRRDTAALEDAVKVLPTSKREQAAKLEAAPRTAPSATKTAKRIAEFSEVEALTAIATASNPDLDHRVSRAGETLDVVAQWYTGDSSTVKELAALNKIQDPDVLTFGQRIMIPSRLLRRRDPLPEVAVSEAVNIGNDALQHQRARARLGPPRDQPSAKPSDQPSDQPSAKSVED